MMDEIQYLKGPRFVNGVNLDADILADHPKTVVRQITDPVNDGSLGAPAYAEGSRNKDGTPL